MSRYCPEIDDHEWVDDPARPERGTFCQACGLDLEDAGEVHSMMGEAAPEE